MDKINTYTNIIKNAITEIHDRYAKPSDDVKHHLIMKYYGSTDRPILLF